MSINTISMSILNTASEYILSNNYANFVDFTSMYSSNNLQKPFTNEGLTLLHLACLIPDRKDFVEYLINEKKISPFDGGYKYKDSKLQKTPYGVAINTNNYDVINLVNKWKEYMIKNENNELTKKINTLKKNNDDLFKKNDELFKKNVFINKNFRNLKRSRDTMELKFNNTNNALTQKINELSECKRQKTLLDKKLKETTERYKLYKNRYEILRNEQRK